MATVRINVDRLIEDLQTLRSFGACGTGVQRQAFSDSDVESRKWLAQRMSAANLKSSVDAVGNVFGIPDGQQKCLLVGSHSDSQLEGGWLDGAFGVITGLEIARASLESGGPPVACVSFQEEEGRFASLLGSRYWAGQLTLNDADALVDANGLAFERARQRVNEIAPVGEVPPDRFKAYLEIHIEQGPVLDSRGLKLAVVESIVGSMSERIAFVGEQNHAGTTPMSLRKDAFQGLVRFVSDLNQVLDGVVTDKSVWTVGHVMLTPNVGSVVPGRAQCTVQWRDPEDQRLRRMHDVIRATAAGVAARNGLKVELAGHRFTPASACDPEIIEMMSQAAEEAAPGEWIRMHSGALHDAAKASVKMPTGMMFVPSINGISHSFDEDTRIDDLKLGATALADGVSRVAERLFA